MEGAEARNGKGSLDNASNGMRAMILMMVFGNNSFF